MASFSSHLLHLRTQAEKAGIRTHFEIPADTNSPDYQKARQDLNFANHILSLTDDDPDFKEILQKSGLDAEQYRDMMKQTASRAKRQMTILEQSFSFPTNEFLDYVIQENEQQLRRIGFLEKKIKKISSLLHILIGVLIVLLIFVVIYFVPAYFSSAASTSANNRGNSSASSNTDDTRICGTPGGTKYHLASCPTLANSSNLIFFDDPDDAISNGYSACSICFGSDSSSETPAESTSSVNPDSNLIQVARPQNGSMLECTNYDDEFVAPFTIETSGDSSYYLKMENADDPDQYIIYFIWAGHTAELNMPIGNFYMKYASGETWYGEQHLFGSKTTYTKSDDLFEFYYDGDYVNGYTVTLYPVPNGNLDTKTITALDF